MPRLSPIAAFLLRLALFYAILVAPWPGWERMEGAYMRALAQGVFGGLHGNREITFESLPDRPGRTRVVIVNPALMARDGSGPVRNLDLDLDRLGIRPLALFLALVFATPVPWRRRCLAAIVGFLLLHACLLAFLSYSLWVESAEVHLADLSQGAKAVAAGAEGAMIGQIVIALPVLMWMLVTLRREGYSHLLRRTSPEEDSQAGKGAELAEG